MHLVEVFKVNAIVELRKLQDDLDGLWFVVTGETAMALTVKDTLAALED